MGVRPRFFRNLLAELVPGLYGENDRRTLESVAILGSVYVREGKYTQAEAVLTRALEKARRVLRNDDRTTLEMLTPLATALDRQNKWVQAEKVELDELEASRQGLWPRASRNDRNHAFIGAHRHAPETICQGRAFVPAGD